MQASSLRADLSGILHNKKAVLMGVGNVQRGDDAFGPLLAQRLSSQKHLVCFDCEEVPENFTGPVRREKPDVILLVDAIDFGAEPGRLALLQADALTDDRFSSHRPSLRLVMDYLEQETGAKIILLGVQPKTAGYSQQMSQELQATLEALAELLTCIVQKE